MNGIKSVELCRGVNLRFIGTDKFKTNRISFYIHLPLNRETVTAAALLPRVLKRGTEKYPTMSDISKRAEELYGAAVGSGIGKSGDVQLVRFNIEFVNDKFISESIEKDVIELLKQLVLCPKTENGAFCAEYVKQEKENAKSAILGLINDKKEYAGVRCNEIMFEGDPYGIFEYGSVEDLEKIDEKNLYEFYRTLIETAAIDIIVSGGFDEGKIIDEVKSVFGECLSGRTAAAETTAIAKIEENISVKRVTEPMAVTQSKLCMGFNCGTDPLSDEYYGLRLFCCVFGGSPFSKLFNNVREKLSLAYYVFSAVERRKGCMKISAGIEADKFDAAYDEIMLQLEKMKSGDFADDEIVSAKKYMATGMNSVKDSLAATESFYMEQILLGADETPDGVLEKINAVTRDDIRAAANKVQTDTVYFLKGAAADEV